MGNKSKSYAVETTYYRTRRAASCQFTGETIEDGAAVIEYQNTKLAAAGKVQYVLADEWRRVHTAAEVASIVTGTPAKHGCEFQLVFEGDVPENTMVDMLTPNGTQPRWYRTADGVASPRYRQARWQERIAHLEGGVRNGAVIVRLWYEGVYVGSRKLKWSERNRLGRFEKALANRNRTIEMVQEFKANF